MKRQNITKSDMKYRELHDYSDDHEMQVPLQKVTHHRQQQTIEAQIQKNDTLQALALRYHCTIAELKRINKIDKENEIYARTVLHVPVNAFTLLLPEMSEHLTIADNNAAIVDNTFHNNLTPITLKGQRENDTSINDIILNTKLKSNRYTDARTGMEDEEVMEATETTLLNNSSQPDEDMSNPIALKQKNDLFNCSGSDWDLNWICLLIGILALCVAIPLIYVIYIAEHPEHYHNEDNRTTNNHTNTG